jgi:hypothetical protein
VALGKEIIQKKRKKSLPRACTGALGKEIIQKKEKIFAESREPELSAKKLSKKKKKKIFAESRTSGLSAKKLSKKNLKNSLPSGLSAKDR